MPATKTARQALIRSILRDHVVRSQGELADLLAEDDLQVTQATLSRDLVEVGAIRQRDGQGGLRYRIRDDTESGPSDVVFGAVSSRLMRLCAELLVTAQSSGNLCILTTPPGAANFLAQAIDQASLPDVLGTIAGDDTVMVVSRGIRGGQSLADTFLGMAEGARAGRV